MERGSSELVKTGARQNSSQFYSRLKQRDHHPNRRWHRQGAGHVLHSRGFSHLFEDTTAGRGLGGRGSAALSRPPQQEGLGNHQPRAPLSSENSRSRSVTLSWNWRKSSRPLSLLPYKSLPQTPQPLNASRPSCSASCSPAPSWPSSCMWFSL